MARIVSPFARPLRSPIVAGLGQSSAAFDWLLAEIALGTIPWADRPDPGFVTPATNGSATNNVADRSGGGDPLVQATGLNKPSLLTAWRAGRPAIDYSGTRLMTTTSAHCPTEDYSWGGVFEFDSVTGSRCPFALGATGVPALTSEGGLWTIRYIGGSNCVGGASSTGVHSFVVTRATGLTGVTKLYVDGVLQTLTPSAVTQGTPSGALVAGCLDTSKNFGFDGKRAESWLRTGVMSQSQVTVYHGYTTTRYQY